MQETKYFCDICKKELGNIYYTSGICVREGFITRPMPAIIDCCSIECIEKRINELKQLK